jgi:hypothetical protein
MGTRLASFVPEPEYDMTDKHTQELAQQGNMEKDPDDWVTGDEPMTGAQRSYLKTLSEEAKVPFEDQLTKAEASRRIDELQAMTGRGTPRGRSDDAGEATVASGSSPRRAVGEAGTSAADADGDETPMRSLGEAVTAPILGAGDGAAGGGDGSRTTGSESRGEGEPRRR